MKRHFSTATVTGLAIALAACGVAEAPAGNEAANDMNAMMADPDNPFANAEMQMNEAMMAAVGSDAGDSWAKKMIAHHQGAIDMSRLMLEHNPPADVAKMARETIDKNERDIADILKLLKDGAPDRQSAELYRPAMMDMHQKMMAAKGMEVSETFMRKMLEHHRGAVKMSDVALASGVGGALRAQIEKTKKMNQDDAKVVEAMLRGKPMEAAKAETSAPAVGTSTAATQAKPAARPAAKPAPKSPPPPAPDPHSGHDMNTM